MEKHLKAFEIKVNGKKFDYRLGQDLNLKEIKSFFEKKYKVVKLIPQPRHVTGILKKDNQELFLKLAKSIGIGEVTKFEYKWNQEFNNLIPRDKSNFWVPKNFDSGIYKNNFFYLITDKFEGKLLAGKPEKGGEVKDFLKYIPAVVELSELIANLKIGRISSKDTNDYQKWFFLKTESWYRAIPKEIRDKYKIDDLLKIVNQGCKILDKRCRHGDFAPWHIFKLKNGKLGLIDGEHVMKNGVEYYDMGYFIQRVFTVLENPLLAKKILTYLINKGYKLDKLKIILAARGIGGFLDEFLKPKLSNYKIAEEYKKWVTKFM